MTSSRAVLIWFLLFCCLIQLFYCSASSRCNRNSSTTHRPPLHGFELSTDMSFDAVSSSGEANRNHHNLDNGDEVDDHAAKDGTAPALKLHLKHRSTRDAAVAERSKESLEQSTHRDVLRIQTLFRRITQRKNQNAFSRLAAAGNRRPEMSQKAAGKTPPEHAGRLMAKVSSGVALGSGEYFIDVFLGTLPRHFSLILDTGSDLNWIQCLPCHDCFEQRGPVYDPAASSSYRSVSCGDPRCGLVLSLDPPRPCRRDQANRCNNNIVSS